MGGPGGRVEAETARAGRARERSAERLHVRSAGGTGLRLDFTPGPELQMPPWRLGARSKLVRRLLTNSSVEGDRVLDPFLGSGSTLIAAELLRRRCFGIELDPRYVDVAIARWESFTGQRARRL